MIKDLEDFLYEQERDLNERFANCNTVAKKNYLNEMNVKNDWLKMIMEELIKKDVFELWQIYHELTSLEK